MGSDVLEQLVNSLVIGSVYSLVAIGLTRIWGVMNIINFAHGDFLMLGMFAALWLYTLVHLNPIFLIPRKAGGGAHPATQNTPTEFRYFDHRSVHPKIADLLSRKRVTGRGDTAIGDQPPLPI